MSVAVSAFSFVLVATAAAACSGGGSGSVSSGTSAGTNDSFVQQFCAFYQPCCQQHGLKTDGMQCRALAQLGASQGSYDSAAGSACLSEMQALSTKPDFCDSPPNPKNCDRVYRSQNSGNKQPGDACTDDDDCAPSSEGDVDCRYRFSSDGGESRTCQVLLTGKAGDTPCLGTRDGNVTQYNTKTDASRGYICDVKDGVRCDSTDNACKALGKPGEPCSSSESCVDTAYCDTSTSTNRVCADRLPLDGDCSKNSQSCRLTDYCTKDTKKCAARAANGATCTTDDMCTSDECLNGTCQPGTSSTSGFSLICGKK